MASIYAHRQKEAPVAAPSQGREKRFRGTGFKVCEPEFPPQGWNDRTWVEHLSNARLAPYAGDGASLEAALRRHWWNLLVCESLYPTLQLLEVVLRNKVSQAMNNRIGTGWMEGAGVHHSVRCAEDLRRAMTAVAKRKTAPMPDDWVAELGFGFWCALHGPHYEQPRLCGHAPFPALIKRVYPLMPKSLHSRRDIKSDLERMRRLRNRIFHHERIIHWVDLDQQVELAVRYLGWMGQAPECTHHALSRYRDVRAGQITDTGGFQPQ